jgi:phospholipid transport system substrate-binding protein
MRAAVIAAVAALGLSAPAAHAAEESATAALRARDAEIRAALPPEGGEVSPAVRRKLEGVITKAVDLRGMIEAAMGQYWSQATERQRKRLVGAFEGRFRSASGKELDTYRSMKVDYEPERDAGEGVVQVPTRVVVKGEPTAIVYAMRRAPQGWRIVDIVVDDVSTVQNYRSSFDRIIRREGIDGLIARLERGTAGGAQKSASAAK